MDEYKKYLSENVLAHRTCVTYRLLSRALNVHVNTAKQMMFDFHQSQNALQPGTVLATYLISGSKTPLAKAEIQQDIEMDGAAIAATAARPQDTSGLHITIVPEVDLDAAISQYSHVISAHIYSLSVEPYKDLQLLSEAARRLIDSADAFKPPGDYGAIICPGMKMRERKPDPSSTIPTRPAPDRGGSKPSQPDSGKPAPASSPPPPPMASPEVGKHKERARSKPNPNRPPSSGTKPSASAPQRAAKTSAIMQSFARAAAKPKSQPKMKESKPPPQQQQETSPPAALVAADDHEADEDEDEDEDESEDEDEDEEQGKEEHAVDEPEKPAPRRNRDAGGASTARREREAGLLKMMDEPDCAPEAENTSPEPAEELSDEVHEELDDKPDPDDTPAPVADSRPATAAGRKRGRRRVMKKKQVMDEQGYLVTIQEPDWESFSEDDVPSSSGPRASTAPSTASQKSSKPPKKAPAKNQGNIMSFFSKK